MAATQEVSSEVKLGEQLEAAMTAAAPVAVGVQGEVVMAAVRVVDAQGPAATAVAATG